MSLLVSRGALPGSSLTPPPPTPLQSRGPYTVCCNCDVSRNAEACVYTFGESVIRMSNRVVSTDTFRPFHPTPSLAEVRGPAIPSAPTYGTGQADSQTRSEYKRGVSV